tara:strand:- start:142 stop:246 length:105 start_codon:yes stop_codon:yes gene_type:complete
MRNWEYEDRVLAKRPFFERLQSELEVLSEESYFW